MAVNEFANLTGVSDKKLPRAQAIIVFETMMELHRNGLLAEVPSLEDIIKIILTNTRDIRSTCQTYNDYHLTQSAQRSLDAAICITDAGKTTPPLPFPGSNIDNNFAIQPMQGPPGIRR